LRKENRQLAAAPEAPPVARAKTEVASEADVAGGRIRAPMAPPAAASPSPAPATAESAAGAVGGLQAPRAEQQARNERTQPRLDSAPKPQVMAAKQSATADTATESERDAVEQRPEDWLQKIIRLRLDGRHDEAEAELKRFRERYPQSQVPPAALGPSGTR
jgi:TolA-binding protein